MSNLLSILHATVIVADLSKALQFYCDVLGLSVDSKRPNLGYPCAWLDVGKQQVHLMQLPNPDPITGRPEHGRRDRHFAFAVAEIEHLRLKLDEAGVGYSVSKSGRKALFCHDPDSNALEFIETPPVQYLP